MGEVTAMGEVHAKNGVARVEQRHVGGGIGLGTGMGLDVSVFGVKKFFGTIAGQVFDDVGILAAAVVPFAGVAFGILIREDTARGFESGFGNEVLAGD